MVLIHLKNSDTDQFLAQVSYKDSNDVVIEKLVKLWNMRLRIGRLCDAATGLAEYGPAKPEKERGLDDIQELADEDAKKHGESVPERTRNEHYVMDPSGSRTGNRCRPDLADVIKKTCEDARAAISKNQVAAKVPLEMDTLKEKIENIRGAVMICYPQGLPPYDPVRLELEEDESEVAGAAAQQIIDLDDATLWWAGKELPRGKMLGDRTGRNEKTKIVAKLVKKGAGAPAREPAVTEDERKAMMAHYFKKQEEYKKMAEDDEDDYTTSSWANPKALKSSLIGGSSGVAFRPGGRRL